MYLIRDSSLNLSCCKRLTLSSRCNPGRKIVSFLMCTHGCNFITPICGLKLRFWPGTNRWYLAITCGIKSLRLCLSQSALDIWACHPQAHSKWPLSFAQYTHGLMFRPTSPWSLFSLRIYIPCSLWSHLLLTLALFKILEVVHVLNNPNGSSSLNSKNFG